MDHSGSVGQVGAPELAKHLGLSGRIDNFSEAGNDNLIPFIQSRSSWQLSMTTILIMLIGAYLPYSPLAVPLGFVPLPPLFWLILLATLLCYVGLTQVIKTWLVRKAWV